jgi:hypothetical protein
MKQPIRPGSLFGFLMLSENRISQATNFTSDLRRYNKNH